MAELRVVGQGSVEAAMKSEMSFAFQTVKHAKGGEENKHEAEGSQNRHRQMQTVVGWLQGGGTI